MKCKLIKLWFTYSRQFAITSSYNSQNIAILSLHRLIVYGTLFHITNKSYSRILVAIGAVD